MTVSAEDAAAIGVIEQNEITHHLVLIGREFLTKDTKRRIAVSFQHVAEHLIVRAVFFDDIDDVFDGAGFADAFRNGPGGLVCARFGEREFNAVATIIFINSCGKFWQVALLRHRHERYRAEVMMLIEAGLAFFLVALGRDGMAFDVRNAKRFALRIKCNCSRKPPDRNQAQQF